MPLEPAIVPAAVSSSRFSREIKLQATVSLRRNGKAKEGVRRPAKRVYAKKPSWTKAQANDKS